MALGISAFLDNVSWQNKSAVGVRDDLRILVNEVRGEIVHKGTTPSALNFAGLTNGRTSCRSWWRGWTLCLPPWLRPPTGLDRGLRRHHMPVM